MDRRESFASWVLSLFSVDIPLFLRPLGNCVKVGRRRGQGLLGSLL